MSKSLLTVLKSTPIILMVGLLDVSADKGNLEPLTANANIWKSSHQILANKFPHIKWLDAKPHNSGSYVVSEMKDRMTFWGQPVQQVKLNLSKEKKLIQSLHFVICDQQSSKMTDDEFNKEATKWNDLVSKKLHKESQVMPSIQIGDDEYTRLAWDGKQSTIVLAIVKNNDSKRIELICHEQSYGLARLRLSGKQTDLELAGDSDADGEARKLTSKEIGNIGVAKTRSLQKVLEIKENFDAEWPKLVKADSPEITIIKEDEETKEFIYHSPNYEFICDVKISKNVIKNFSTLFEATRLYCQEMPISMVKAHMPEDSMKFKILLFGGIQDYFKNGGPQGSAGVYYPGKGIILVPLSSLGVKKVGSSYMFDYKVSNKTLPHEITHQLTNTEYFNAGARGWFSEGLAEYVAATGYRSGKFMVNGNLNDIRSYVTEGSRKDGRGRYLGEEFAAPDLKHFMTMSYGEFTANGNFNYGLGALVTYYFLHMDGEGDRKRINAFLTYLNDGKSGEVALKMLLDGRSYDELEADISKAWKTRGIKINFK